MNNNSLSVKEIVAEYKAQLILQYGENEVMQFLYLLFEAWKGWTKAQVHLGKAHELSIEEVSRFNHALLELKNNNPIQYVIGETSFHGFRLKVNRDVLIPRPETEELVSVVERGISSEKHEDLSILDIGTGSGCIAISLKKMFPHAKITALDISLEALRIARENAAINNCDIQFLQADILDENTWKSFSTYHVIISNPPYITESEKAMMERNVLDYEPAIALFVPDENPLLYYRAISDFAATHLFSSGKLFFEINEHFVYEIKELLLSKGFNKVDMLTDFRQKNRFVRAEY